MTALWYFKGSSFRYPIVLCTLGISKILLNVSTFLTLRCFFKPNPSTIVLTKCSFLHSSSAKASKTHTFSVESQLFSYLTSFNWDKWNTPNSCGFRLLSWYTVHSVCFPWDKTSSWTSLQPWFSLIMCLCSFLKDQNLSIIWSYLGSISLQVSNQIHDFNSIFFHFLLFKSHIKTNQSDKNTKER